AVSLPSALGSLTNGTMNGVDEENHQDEGCAPGDDESAVVEDDSLPIEMSAEKAWSRAEAALARAAAVSRRQGEGYVVRVGGDQGRPISAVLDEYRRVLEERTEYHFGYPYSK